MQCRHWYAPFQRSGKKLWLQVSRQCDTSDGGDFLRGLGESGTLVLSVGLAPEETRLGRETSKNRFGGAFYSHVAALLARQTDRNGPRRRRGNRVIGMARFRAVRPLARLCWRRAKPFILAALAGVHR